MTEQLPITLCWHCDRALDAATDIEGALEPEEGAISLCMYCGAIATFGEDLRLIRPTKEDLDALEEMEEFRKAFVKFNWARQYVMIEHSLMRNGEDPDR
jgi:hypothetical protein